MQAVVIKDQLARTSQTGILLNCNKQNTRQNCSTLHSHIDIGYVDVYFRNKLVKPTQNTEKEGTYWKMNFNRCVALKEMRRAWNDTRKESAHFFFLLISINVNVRGMFLPSVMEKKSLKC